MGGEGRDIQNNKEKWKEAANALDAAIKRGKLKNTGQAYLLKGIAHFSMKHSKSARAAFSQAREDESVIDSVAEAFGRVFKLNDAISSKPLHNPIIAPHFMLGFGSLRLRSTAKTNWAENSPPVDFQSKR